MNKDKMHHLFSAIQSTPTLPSSAQRLGELANDTEPDIDALIDVLLADPAAAARVLRAANSPYYGFHQQIFSVREAAFLLGASTLATLAAGMPSLDEAEAADDRRYLDNIWVHSRAVAMAATIVARRVMFPYRDKAYTAGLLHDIGKLVVASAAQKQHSEILRMARSYRIPISYAEKVVIGFDHADLGGDVLAQWDIPSSLVEAVRLHHHPTRSGAPYDLSGIVYLADYLVHRTGIGANPEDIPDELDPVVLGYFGLNRASLLTLQQQIEERNREIEAAAHRTPSL